MGERDIESIHPVYLYCNEISKENNYPFKFKEDSGKYETAIQIMENGMILMPPQQVVSGEIFVPDILDFHNKIILEYEEECKPNKGAKRRKGHFELNNHDSNRDTYYTKIANPPFRLHKIWESDKDWKKGVKEFLDKCFKEMTQ